MKIAVMISASPYNHEASDSAYNFIQAAMEKGHQIRGVFLYNDGVHNVNKLMDPPQDDRHIAKRWSELGEAGIDIVVCIAAGKRRGVVDENLIPNARISGMGQFTEMATDSDRLVVFGE